MWGYVDLYTALRDAGYSEREAAKIVDLAVCEDALERRLGRPPTEEEVEAEHDAMIA